MKISASSLMVLFLVFLAGTANATLWDRGGGLIYDDVFDITLLQDINYAFTSGYDDDGDMTWVQAKTWADELDYYDPVRDLTWSDWRLPTALNSDGSGPDFGHVSGSEMGHLYYYYGIGVYLYTTNDGKPVFAEDPFLNFNDGMYWTNTKVENVPLAWRFGFHAPNGWQSYGTLNDTLFAWAVMDGDVAPIPEPSTIFLFSFGLLGLARLRMKSRKHN